MKNHQGNSAAELANYVTKEEAIISQHADHHENNDVVDEDNDDELELNPFLTIGTSGEDDDNEERILSLFSPNESDKKLSAQKSKVHRRNWGIPDFEDQCNGISIFTLYPVNDEGEPQNSENGQVKVNLEHRLHSTGSDLWDAALVLAHALERPGIIQSQSDCRLPVALVSDNFASKMLLQDTLIVELGSGTGAVGLFCHKCLGAQHVILTDLEPNLDLIRSNQRENCIPDESVSILTLDWCDKTLPSVLQNEITARSKNCDQVLIIGSDLFLPFAPNLLQPLARTIRDLLLVAATQQLSESPQFSTAVRSEALICYEERFDCSPFFDHARTYGLVIERLDPSLFHPIYRDPELIHILRCRLIRPDEKNLKV